jgi:hypothetical protein
MRAQQASVIDIAALVGVTPSRIRQIVLARGIKQTGRRGKAKLYDPNDFLDIKVGHHTPRESRVA